MTRSGERTGDGDGSGGVIAAGVGLGVAGFLVDAGAFLVDAGAFLADLGAALRLLGCTQVWRLGVRHALAEEEWIKVANRLTWTWGRVPRLHLPPRWALWQPWPCFWWPGSS